MSNDFPLWEDGEKVEAFIRGKIGDYLFRVKVWRRETEKEVLRLREENQRLKEENGIYRVLLNRLRSMILFADSRVKALPDYAESDLVNHVKDVVERIEN